MEDFVIAVASTADFEVDWLKAHNVPFIPYTFVVNGKEYSDDCTEETKDFVFDQMLKGESVSTSAISVYAYHEFFKSLMETGKNVLYTDMCSAVSSSINNVRLAEEMIKEEYPNQKFYFLDSFSITGILGLLVKKMVEMKEAGASYEEVIAFGEDNKRKYSGRFMVDDLQWLRKGGRLSNASAFAATILSIKPCIYVAEDGSLVAYKKVHGKRKAWSSLIDDAKEDMVEGTTDAEILYAGNKDEAEVFKELVIKTYPQLENIGLTNLGPVIGAHVGPGFMGFTYKGKGRVM